MKHTITVLQDDIDNGIPGSSIRCPEALAANRDLFLDNVRIDGKYLLAGAEFHALLPAEASNFVRKFDGGCTVEPFKFEIETVDGLRPARVPAYGLDMCSASAWTDEIMNCWSSFSQVLTGLDGGVLGFVPAAHQYQYQQFAGYHSLVFKAAIEDKHSNGPWTPDFGSVPMTYDPPTWTAANLDVTATS